LKLSEAGLSDAACLDFDFAIRALKRWADRRSDATEMVPDHSPERKQRMKPVPKYPTLQAVLGIADDEQASVDSGVVDELVTAMLTRQTDWQGYGV
jgi:hypothetical protein